VWHFGYTLDKLWISLQRLAANEKP